MRLIFLRDAQYLFKYFVFNGTNNIAPVILGVSQKIKKADFFYVWF